MRKYFDYWKIKKDKLTLTEAIKLYNEYSKSDQHKFMDVALYHSWDGKLDLHHGRLIGPYDKVIEQQQFTIAEFEATDWMLLEIDEELEKKLHTAYNYVVDWCLHRMDNMREDKNFPYKNQLDLTYFWKEVNDIVRRNEWYYHEELDMKDAIILHYRNIISNIESKYFDELLVKPNPNVLPLHYGVAYYNDGKYRPNHEPDFEFADMHCDVIEKINNMFPAHEEQNIEDGEFERQEAWIRGKRWQDVIVLVGSDSFLDCEEVEIPGDLLNNSNNKHYNDNDFLDLNIYEHTINFDNSKNYVCRVKKEIEHWSWGDDIKYKLMSVLKEK